MKFLDRIYEIQRLLALGHNESKADSIMFIMCSRSSCVRAGLEGRQYCWNGMKPASRLA
jgi:hypothetical protein